MVVGIEAAARGLSDKLRSALRRSYQAGMKQGEYEIKHTNLLSLRPRSAVTTRPIMV